MQTKTNKKGQTLGTLGSSILAIVVVSIVLVLGIILVQSMRDADVVKKANTDSLVNKTTVTVVTAAGALVNNAPGCIVTVVTASMANTTQGIIPSNNYTVSECKIFATTGVHPGYNNSFWNITGTYTSGGVAYVSGNSSIEGLSDFSDFVPLIVIALAASIIIGLILTGFAFRRQR